MQILVLTNFQRRRLVQDALQAGAIGYCSKRLGQELAEAIPRSPAAHLSPEAAQVLIRSATRPRKRDYDLTPRELEVLSLLVSGMNNNEIAEKLVVSRSTVKFHVSSILSKLNVSSRTEAVALAIQQKLVT